MNPSTQSSPARRGQATWAAALTGSVLAALLVACGGGGDAPTAGPGTATATAQSFASGPISGLGSIIVNGVRFDDGAARVEDEDGAAHAARELKLGMMVEVQAGVIDDKVAKATATHIRFGSEMVGAVTLKDDASSTLRMLDQTIEVKPTTVFEEGLAGFSAISIGQVLEIHAQFDAATGHYVATRIEREDGATAFRLRGRVASLDTALKTFKIGDAVINYGNVAAADLPALADGLRVRVRLQTTQVNGQWVATGVRTGVRRVDDIGDARLRGLITVLTSPQQFEIQGIVVDASNASFEPNAEAVRLGALVEVRGRAADGKIIAARVKVRDERDDDLQRVELHGTVSLLDASTFMLRDVKVNFSRVIEWKNGGAADLANGKALEVKGVWSEDRKVLFALVIEFES